MKRTAVIALVGGLAGCGDNLVDPHGVRSGARLKLVRYAYDGEPIEIDQTRFYDSELEQFCTIQTWSDGAHYCTPPLAEAVFENELCTLPVGIGLGGDLGAPPPPYFAAFYAQGHTSSVSALYRNVGVAEPPQRFWRRTELGCAGPFFPETGDGSRYYVVAGPLPVADLRVKLTMPSEGERLGEVFATTDDGLRRANGVHDNELALDCRIDSRPNATATECVPTQLDSSITRYADASCTEPLILSWRTPGIATDLRAGTSCVDYYAPTVPVAPAAVYQRIGDDCVSETLPGGVIAYAIHRLEPALVPRVPGGAGRVQAIRLGPLSSMDTLLHDAQLASDCRRVMLPEGEERCLPTATGTLTRLFTDETCATDVPIALVPHRECDVAGPYVSGSDIHAIGEPHPGPLFELTTGDRCRAFVPQAGYVAHDVGPAIPHEQFPLATLVIDP